MTIKELAAKLNTTTTSLNNWLKRFGDHFSEGAKQRHKAFTQVDLDTLATIAVLSSQGMNYDAIDTKLQTDERENFADTTLGIDSRMVPAAAMEQVIDATEVRIEAEQLRAERDKLLDTVAILQTQLSTIQGKHSVEKETLLREIGDLKERAARAEMEAELLKKRRWFWSN